MILSIGEVLFDEFPEYRRIGGAPFNFARHLKKLGMQVRFVSRIGRDERGEEIRNLLAAEGFDAGDVQVDPLRPTGRVVVTMDGAGGHDFTIIPDVAYDVPEVTDRLESLLHAPPRLLYFGSLIQRTESGFAALSGILDRTKPETTIFYDMNLRAGCRDRSIVERSLRHTDVLKLNDEELAWTVKTLHLPAPEEDAVKALQETYHIARTAVTKGAGGGVLYTGGKGYASPAATVDRLVDTVGAGDAFAAVLAAGLLSQAPPDEILSAAVDLAGRICGVEGAVPDDDALYEPIRSRLSAARGA